MLRKTRKPVKGVTLCLKKDVSGKEGQNEHTGSNGRRAESKQDNKEKLGLSGGTEG